MNSNEFPPPPAYHLPNPSYLAPADEKYLYDPYSPSASRPASPLPPPTPHRGSHESSANESDYDPSMKALMTTPATPPFRTLNVMHTKSHINMRIADAATGQILYYVDNSSFTPGKPDVTLCHGSEKTDPTAGVAKWSSMYSKHLKIGVGNLLEAAGEKNMTWEEVRTGHIRHPEFRWSITSPVSGQRHEFAWVRMHGTEALTAAGEGTNTMSFKNFKLVESAKRGLTGEGEVLAVYASNTFKSWSKMGKILVKVDGAARGWGGEWEVMVLLSVLGLVEMSRRRARQRRSSGAQYG